MDRPGGVIEVVCGSMFSGKTEELIRRVRRAQIARQRVQVLTAICMVCGAPATRTQRLVDGRPAQYTDPVILIGARESYEARCRRCHEVPGHPML